MARINHHEFKPIDFIQELFYYGPVTVFRWANEEGWPAFFVSPNVRKTFGYVVKDFISKKITYESLIHQHDKKRVARELQRNTKKDLLHFKHDPYRIIRADGSIRWVDDYTTIIKDENGNVTEYIGYIIDVTNRVETEQELIDIRDRYIHVLKATQEGVWDWDLRTDEVFFSAQWKWLLGHSEDEVGTSLEEWEKRVHPEDIQKCFEDVKAHLNGETPIYQNIHRVRHKNGSYRWILDRGVKILDKDGNPHRMIGTHKDITEEKQLREKIEKMAVTDELTNLYNRRKFFEVIEKEVDRSSRYGEKLSCIMIDIDYFKKINDQYGHDCGDKILKRFAKTLQSIIRKTDIAFRIGGEEFCVVCPHSNTESSFQVAERLRNTIEKSYNQYKNKKICYTISCGVAQFIETDSIDSLIKKADEALYESKKKGRNRTSIKE